LLLVGGLTPLTLAERTEVAMKRSSVIILPVFLLVMLAAGSIYAQDRLTVIRGDIPFDFVVGDKTLPAGSYKVNEVLAQPNMPRIQNTQNREVVAFLTISVENGKQVKPMFVFRRYGEQYYLAQIWNGSNAGIEVPKSSKERQVAKNYSEPQIIYIAAK
jgi:hypothetical protein